jgi:hypothetical protein
MYANGGRSRCTGPMSARLTTRESAQWFTLHKRNKPFRNYTAHLHVSCAPATVCWNMGSWHYDSRSGQPNEISSSLERAMTAETGIWTHFNNYFQLCNEGASQCVTYVFLTVLSMPLFQISFTFFQVFVNIEHVSTENGHHQVHSDCTLDIAHLRCKW